MRTRSFTIGLLVLSLAGSLSAATEEKIRGVLEKTARPGACAQITDALAEIYYINGTDEAEMAVSNYVGKNIKVVITGSVETKEGDTAYFFALKTVERYVPKLPTSPPPSSKHSEENKSDANNGSAKTGGSTDIKDGK